MTTGKLTAKPKMTKKVYTEASSNRRCYAKNYININNTPSKKNNEHIT